MNPCSVSDLYCLDRDNDRSVKMMEVVGDLAKGK